MKTLLIYINSVTKQYIIRNDRDNTVYTSLLFIKMSMLEDNTTGLRRKLSHYGMYCYICDRLVSVVIESN